MHSFERMNGQHQYTGSLPQTASHFSHNASSSWTANNMHQYMNANSGLQQPQGANIAFHNVVSANGQIPNRQCSKGLRLAANLSNNNLKGCNRMLSGIPTNTSNSFPSPTCGPQIVTPQYSHSHYSNQSLASYSSPTTTYHFCNQTAAGTEAPTSRIQNASHLQQNQSSHSLHQSPTGYFSPYPTIARSLPHQQMVNPGSSTSAASQNVQTFQLAYYNAALQCSSLTLAQNVSNTSERSQQARTQPNSSYYNCEGPTNSRNTNLNNQYTCNPFLRQTNEVPRNYNAQQQMVRTQLNADNLAKSSTVESSYQLPPAYESHFTNNNSRLSNQTMQPVTSAGSQSCNMSATQPLPLHSVQTLPQGVVSRGPLTVNPPLQQNTLPVGFTVNTAGGVRGGEVAVNVSLPSNDTVSKSCPAGFQSRGPSELSSARINKTFEYLKQHPRLIQILGHSPTVQPNDESAQPVPANSITRAVAVVLPLSQEDGRASTHTPTCNPKKITDTECITPEVAKEAAFVEEESNLDQEDPDPVTVNNTVASDVVTSSDSESPSTSQSSEQDSLGPTAQKCSDTPPSQALPEEQNEVTKPPSPPVIELSSIPTITWTMDSLNSLLETEKAQVTPRENSNLSVRDQILHTFWNLDIVECLKCYKEAVESNFYSHVSFLCKYIPKDRAILSQVHPYFRDHLKQHYVLKDDDVYSEQPYKSLWLNVNDQLDDIDKEFGFPWTLRQHLYAHETFSQISTADDVPELVPREVQKQVSSQLTSETVDLTVSDEEEASAVATPPPPSEDTSSDLSCSFKLDVLSPEEARAIYEKVQNPVHQDHDNEDVKEVSDDGSLQPKISNDMDATAEPSTKNKPEQIQVICCFAQFMEMHSLAASSSLKCTCKEKQSRHESIVKPDLENSPENTDNETITLSAPEHCFKIDKIIDLSNVDDDLYSHSDQASETSDGSWLNIASSSDIMETESASESVNLAIAETQPEDETLKGEVKSTETTQSASSVSCSTQTGHEELCNSETKDILQISNHEENCDQVEEAAACLENEGQTQITNTSFSLRVKEKTNEDRQKRQSSLEQRFPGLSTPKKPKLPTASSVSCATQTGHEELCKSETKDILQISNHEENCDQAEEAEACLENEGQTQITNTSFSLHVKEKTNEDRQKRQSSLEQCFPGLSTPKKPKLPTASSVSGATQSEHGELHSSETEDMLQMSDHEENCEQAEEAEACLENEGQTQISNQTSFSLQVKEKTNEERRKRQSSLEQFFPGPSTPKKPKLPTTPVLLDVPEAQPEALEIKTVKLALFGSRKKNCVLSENKTSPTPTSGSSKLEPPEILSFKLDRSPRKPTESGLAGNYSIKPFLYQVWRNSIPTGNGSVKNGRINKLKRQKRRPVSGSSMGSKEEQHSVSDRKHKGSLSLKKMKKRGRYGVKVCQPANQEPEKKQDGDVRATPLKENIVLKFSILPNTFDFKNGSNGVMEAPAPDSDETKLEEEKDQSPAHTNHSKGMWYSTPGKLYQPLGPPNKVGLFHEYQKRYKEKTSSFSDA